MHIQVVLELRRGDSADRERDGEWGSLRRLQQQEQTRTFLFDGGQIDKIPGLGAQLQRFVISRTALAAADWRVLACWGQAKPEPL
ncbi:MAG: hypothetical protein CMJ75_17340 [Planctomycetaceae bacterium]|nr:hypothetical protein [Planctomycetaceae bacterium]